METNSHLNKARQMIQGIYGRKGKNKDNYSIVENHRAETMNEPQV
jgi:hypothetical protein